MASRCKNSDPCELRPKFVKKDLPTKCEAKMLDTVRQACQLYDDYVDMATAIKQNLDKDFGPTWHVFVGPNFASHIMHEKKAFAHVKCNNLSFLIYRYG
ncbi:unnamed protein product [Schistocephalus solidus]|uniref:Dynein light chain n=1 Tax=Schistocephalus solidus TaxID=70667 RepID=A0A183SE96_SCHSO|nr:unnamed protein product [Schistocephalus solidus]